MKAHQLWQLPIKDMKSAPLPRGRTSPKKHLCILVVAFVSIVTLWAYLYPPQHYTSPMRDWLPAEPVRELTDQERASQVVFKQILSTPPVKSKRSKVAFMFLTPGTLPFERLWEKFFEVRYHFSSTTSVIGFSSGILHQKDWSTLKFLSWCCN